jgi:hypothetical protein
MEHILGIDGCNYIGRKHESGFFPVWGGGTYGTPGNLLDKCLTDKLRQAYQPAGFLGFGFKCQQALTLHKLQDLDNHQITLVQRLQGKSQDLTRTHTGASQIINAGPPILLHMV